jgi:hypothetical protein
MSVYSGFATRIQETQYNACIERVLLLLCKRTIWNIKDGTFASFSAKISTEKFDVNKWNLTFGKLFKNIHILEKHKHYPPKLGETLVELASLLGFEPVINL